MQMIVILYNKSMIKWTPENDIWNFRSWVEKELEEKLP